MKWFGESWGAAICSPANHTTRPIGAHCQHCADPINEGEQGVIYDNGPAAHVECFIRGAVGSLGHQAGYCMCARKRVRTGLSYAMDDPPGLSQREAARAAFQFATARTGEERGAVLLRWLSISIARGAA